MTELTGYFRKLDELRVYLSYRGDIFEDGYYNYAVMSVWTGGYTLELRNTMVLL